MITFAIFQLDGWMPKLMHRLKKKCRKFKRASLRCLISLLLMRSVPGTFLMSKLLMILSKSLIVMNSSWSSVDFKGAISGLRQLLATESSFLMKNVFYFTSKALFILALFVLTFWSCSKTA